MADARDPDFYLAHANYVRALARRLVYDHHAADDLFQAAWLAALQRPARDESTPRRWLASIVRNLASKSWLHAQRRERRERQWQPPPPATTPDAVLAHEHERRRLVDAMLALDEPYRATLIARFFDGLEATQIAERDGVPVETVRTRQKRGLEQLRQRLLRGGGSAMALAHGLQLGAPTTRAVLGRVLRGVILMHTKKLLLSAGVLLVATLGWLAVSAPAPNASEAAGPPTAAAAPSAAAEPTPRVDTAPAHRAELAVAPETVAAGGELEVYVQWADRRPAADIGVQVGVTAASNFEAHAQRGRTGSNGTVRFANLAPGEAWVECDRGTSKSVAIRVGQRSSLTLTIESGVLVRGQVFDLDGRPARGAAVHLVCGFVPHSGHVVAHAADDGTFTVVDAPADHAVSLSAFLPQRAPSPQQVVTARMGTTVDVELRFVARGGAIAGRAIDERGAPVAGAMVLVGPELGIDIERAKSAGRGPLPPVSSRRATTDQHGDWLVEGVATGDTPVLVMAPMLAPWNGGVFVAPGATVRCDSVLVPGARLSGNVRDERGAACVGAAVRVWRSPVLTWATKAGSDGAYVLDGLPTTTFPATATLDGAGEARAEFTGTSGATLPWDPVLRRAITLRGRVVKAGEPVADARIDARRLPSAERPWFADTTSDADGRFEITNCVDGLLHLEVHTTASQPFAVCQRDDVDPYAGEVTLEVDPAREPSAFVAGRVLDPVGEPVADVEVTVLTYDYEWGGGRSMRTGTDGRFRSAAIPAGQWYLTVQREGFARLSVPQRTLAGGATEDFGDLVLMRGSTLVVTLQPEAGIALDRCVLGIADPVTGLGSAKPENGVARFERLAPGDYTITAYAPGAALRPATVRVGLGPETPLAMPITAGSAVTVDLRNARGEPANDRIETELYDGKGARIDFTPMQPGGGPMLYERRLVAGRYELRLRDHHGHRAAVAIVVPEGGKPVQTTATLR